MLLLKSLHLYSCLGFLLILLSTWLESMETMEHHFRHHPKFAEIHRLCSENLMSSVMKVVCIDHKDKSIPVETPCKATFPNGGGPKASWFVSCMAKGIVDKGFQLPVYVVHDKDEERFRMMQRECRFSARPFYFSWLYLSLLPYPLPLSTPFFLFSSLSLHPPPHPLTTLHHYFTQI